MKKQLSLFVAITALAAMVGCSVVSPPSEEWRQDRASPADTFYPGIRFGMTRDEVRARIPESYRVRDEGTGIIAERTHEDGTRERIQFEFEDGRLMFTDDTAF